MNKKDLLKMLTVDNFIIFLLLSILTYLVVKYTKAERFTNPRINYFKNKSRQSRGSPRRNLRESFLNSDKPEVDFYYVDWCGYCKKAKPEIQKLEDEGYTVNKNCCDGKCAAVRNLPEDVRNQQIQNCKDQKIRGYPTVKVKINDKTQELRGPVTAANIKKQIELLKQQL